MNCLRNILMVGIGGALGAMLRYGTTLLFQSLELSSNMATVVVNVIGSFCMGLLIGYFEQNPWLLLATVGICGGFTTYSTYAMQSVVLLQQGRYGMALVYVFGTLLLCISFTTLGFYWVHK